MIILRVFVAVHLRAPRMNCTSVSVDLMPSCCSGTIPVDCARCRSGLGFSCWFTPSLIHLLTCPLHDRLSPSHLLFTCPRDFDFISGRSEQKKRNSQDFMLRVQYCSNVFCWAVRKMNHHPHQTEWFVVSSSVDLFSILAFFSLMPPCAYFSVAGSGSWRVLEHFTITFTKSKWIWSCSLTVFCLF